MVKFTNCWTYWDGNWHSVIFFHKSSNKDINEAKRLNNFIVETALKLDGTSTAEHGIGKHQTKWLNTINTYLFYPCKESVR